MSVPLLEIKGIKVRYSGLPVLHGVSLAVNAGETVCVVGANGAGKSTILRAVMGAQRAFEGQIFLRDVKFSACAPKRSCGWESSIFPRKKCSSGRCRSKRT